MRIGGETMSQKEVSAQVVAKRAPAFAGIACGLLAGICYSAMTGCFRFCVGCDPIWPTCARALVPAMILTPWFLRRVAMGRVTISPNRQFLGLLGGAGLAQFGNWTYQVSLSECGMSVSVPVIFASLLVVSVVITRLVSKEPTTLHTYLAVAVLTASVMVISAGVADRQASQTVSQGRLAMIVGIFAAIVTGVAHAVMSTVIRHVVRSHLKPVDVVAVTTCVGVMGLGTVAVWRNGLDGLLGIPPESLVVMLLGGTLNGVAFVLLAKAFEFISAASGNLFMAVQVATSALVGVALFGEQGGSAITGGVCLTCLGLALAGMGAVKAHRPKSADIMERDGATADSRRGSAVGPLARPNLATSTTLRRVVHRPQKERSAVTSRDADISSARTR